MTNTVRVHPQTLPSHNLAARKKRSFFIFLSLAGILLVVIVSVIFLYLKVFVVHTITCSFGSNPCPEPVLAELERYRNKSIFSSFDALQKKLRAGVTEASSVEVQRKLPSSLLVRLAESEIIGALASDDTYGYMIVNKNLHVVNIVKDLPSGLFIVHTTQRYAVGEQVDAIYPDIMQKIQNVEAKIALSDVVVKDKDTIELHLQSGKTAIARYEGLEEQLNTLQLLLTKATMIEHASVIDLRFSHPVLR